MRVGILAGTFDPIHEGHLALAQAALKQAKLDKVILLIEKSPRRKQPVASYIQRLEMCYAASKNLPWLNIHEMPFENFSIQSTWPVLQSLHQDDELVMIMGDDVFAHLPQWPDVDYLVDNAKFIVAPRHTNDEKKIADTALEVGAEFMIVKNPWPKLSSSKVREELQNGTSSFVPAAVQDYITEHQLYVGKSSENA